MILASGMRRLLTILLSSTTKELVQLGAGVAAVIGGVLAVVTFALSSGGKTAPPPTPVATAVVEAAATVAPTQTSLPTTTTVAPTPTGVASAILDVQFGTVQDKSNGLPGGPTVRSGDSIEACAGTELLGWIRHAYATGTHLKGTWSSRGVALYTNDVSADSQYPTVFFSVFVKQPGIYTLDFQANDGAPVSWSVDVTCKS